MPFLRCPRCGGSAGPNCRCYLTNNNHEPSFKVKTRCTKCMGVGKVINTKPGHVGEYKVCPSCSGKGEY